MQYHKFAILLLGLTALTQALPLNQEEDSNELYIPEVENFVRSKRGFQHTVREFDAPDADEGPHPFDTMQNLQGLISKRSAESSSQEKSSESSESKEHKENVVFKQIAPTEAQADPKSVDSSEETLKNNFLNLGKIKNLDKDQLYGYLYENGFGPDLDLNNRRRRSAESHSEESNESHESKEKHDQGKTTETAKTTTTADATTIAEVEKTIVPEETAA